MSLCPGYQQVEEFGADEEYESGEEISYMTFDLGNIEPTLIPSSSTYRLMGLDTPTPYLQLSGTILKGKHDSLLGTELLFTDEKDLQDRNKHSVVHVANTEQRVSFKEVRLQPKDMTAPQQCSSSQAATSNVAHLQEGADVTSLVASSSVASSSKVKRPKKRGKNKAEATGE